MKNYVEVAYQKKEKPFGKYPYQLAAYLYNRYRLKAGMRVLDNGCGRGEFLHAFGKLGLEAYGTDMSDYCKKARVVDLNSEKLPFEEGFFDVVFTKSVLEHIENVEHYMAEMKRVLKAGGILIIMVPDWETQYLIFYQDPTHIHPYTKKSIERLLCMCDFKSVHVEKFTQLPSVWKSPVMAVLSKVVRLAGPVKKIYRNKFIRFSREQMILGSGIK